jgi:DNA-binding transcriptional regulator YiaG
LAMTGVPVVRNIPDGTESACVVSEVPSLSSRSVINQAQHPRRTSHKPSPLAELRERTNLSVVQLAQLFNVTRATIYSWERGTPPRGERETHVLEALAFVRNASAQFPDTQILKQWLMTPVAPGLDTPLNLMAQRRWRPLRGILLQARTPTAVLHATEPLRSAAQPIERAEFRRVVRNLSPPPALEDVDVTEGEASSHSTGA